MSYRSSEPEDAKNTVLELVSDLRDNVFCQEDEQGDLMVVEFFFKRLHPERIIEHIIKHALPHKQKIENRDVNFFLKNKTIFAGLPDQRIKYYSEIIANGKRLRDEDRQVIWSYFDTFIFLAESYRKVK